MLQLRPTVVAQGAIALFLGALTGCGGGGDNGLLGNAPVGTSSAAATHENIVLKDAVGNALTASSTRPYSPRKTCGECHDVDSVMNGYHFQQGRTDASGKVVVRDDYFADGRAFVRSSGMYGKW